VFESAKGIDEAALWHGGTGEVMCKVDKPEYVGRFRKRRKSVGGVVVPVL
jgi:hypothetical protein